MRKLDELHLNYPFAGSRIMRDLLRGESIAIRRRGRAVSSGDAEAAAKHCVSKVSTPAVCTSAR